MSANTVLLHKKNNIATLILNRPKIMNAMNAQMMRELKDNVEQIAGDDEIRVVIIKGAGNNFSSGADMALLGEHPSPPLLRKAMMSVGLIIQGIRAMPQPVISALRGVAVGAGANLALAGDFVIAADDARFCEIFIHIGAIMDFGGFYFLPRLVGLAKAKELAMLGKEIDGKTAASMGLIYKSVPDEKLDQAVESLADNLLQKPKVALALMKEGLEGSYNRSLKEILDWEAANQAIALQAPEHKEIIRSFLESKKNK